MILLITFAAFPMVLFISTNSSGETIIVDDDWAGADHNSIQDAIDDAASGDVIRVHAGTYFEDVTVDKMVSIVGNSSSDTTMTNIDTGVSYGDTAVTIGSAGTGISGLSIVRNRTEYDSYDFSYGIALQADGITISECRIANFFHGLSYSMTSNNTIENSTFVNNICGSHTVGSDHNTYRNNQWDNSYYDLHIEDSENNTALNNTMVGIGLYLTGTEPSHWSTNSIDTTNTVHGEPICFFKDTVPSVPEDPGQLVFYNVSGVDVEHRSFSQVVTGVMIGFCDDITVSDCSFMDSIMGVAVTGSSNVTIRENDFGNFQAVYYQGAVYVRYSTDCIISDNDIWGASFNGIHVRSSDSIEIIGNECQALIQISLWYSDDCTIKGNELEDGRMGLYLVSSDLTEIAANTVMNNSYKAVYLADDTNDTMVHHNEFWHNGNDSSQGYDEGGDNLWDDGSVGNFWSDYYGADNDGDGIGDTPYHIDGDSNALDRYPIGGGTTEIILEIFLDTYGPVSDRENILFAHITQNIYWASAEVTFYIDGEVEEAFVMEIHPGVTVLELPFEVSSGSHILKVRLEESIVLEKELDIDAVRRTDSGDGMTVSLEGLMAVALVLPLARLSRRRETY